MLIGVLGLFGPFSDAGAQQQSPSIPSIESTDPALALTGRDFVKTGLNWAGEERISIFYFNEELLPESDEEAVTALHASAIQIGDDGDASVWINGVQLRVNERLDRATVLRIGPAAVTLLVDDEHGQSRRFELAINQSLSLATMSLQEGLSASVVRRALPNTRLP